MVAFVNAAATTAYGAPLEPRALPFGTLTDGRSFLAHGMEAITLRSLEEDAFPRNLHSAADSRERLSMAGIASTVGLLKEIVTRVDRGEANALHL